MKNIKGIISIVLALIGCTMSGQEISITSTDACYNSYTGSINIDFDQYAEDYTLPFSGNYYNITIGDYEEIIVESNPLNLTNLAAGEYEFNIFISDDEIMEFCWEVYEYSIADEISIDTYNADCLGDNGRIVINASSQLIGHGTPILATVFDILGEEITSKYVHTGLTQIKDLQGGNYSLKIELPNGCTDFIQFFIQEDQMEVPYEIVSINKSCLDDGGIDIYLDPANGPYGVSWENANTGEKIYAEDLVNVSNGTYCLHIQKLLGKKTCNYSDTCLVIESTLGFRNVEIDHVCDSMSTDGRISMITLHQDYTYKWDTDPPQTSASIDGIGAGKYCVTVTDSDGCEHHECFTIIALTDSLDISFDVVGVCPEIKGGTVTLNVEPFTDHTTVTWDDLPDSEEGLFTRSDLPAGEYIATISNECTSVQESISIGYDCMCTEWLEDAPLHKIKTDCNEDLVGDGFIRFTQTTGLSFLWEDGSTDNQIDGLVVGEYKVTITHDASQCEKVRAIQIDEYQAPELTFSDIEPTCQLVNNGEVEVAIEGSSFSFYWEDLGIGSNQYYRNDLDSGNHTLILNSACGTSFHSIYVPEYSASLSSLGEFSGCYPYSEVTFDVFGDNPPFQLDWDTGDSWALTDVENGEYEYTITDAEGCMFINSYTVPNYIEEVDRKNACKNVNNGSISFQINNPNEDLVQITYEFGPCGECEDFPFIDPTNESQLVVELTQLEGGIPLTFNIKIGNCTYTKTFTIGEDPWERQYVSYEEIDDIVYCTYNLLCDGDVIEEGLTAVAEIDVESTSGGSIGTFQGFGNCGTSDIICEDEVVSSIKMDPIKMRGLEALVFYQNLNIFFGGWWEAQMVASACAYWWVCPTGDIIPSRATGDLLFWGGDQVGAGPSDANGCREILCDVDWGLFSFSDNYEVCLDSIPSLPDWIYPYINNPGEEDDDKSNCGTIKTANVFSLISAFNQVDDDELDDLYIDTELYQFVNQHTNDPARFCADVSYCENDFTVVSSDIDEIDCNAELPEYYYILDDNGEVYYPHACELLPFAYEEGEVLAVCPIECNSEILFDCYYVNQVPTSVAVLGYNDPKTNTDNRSENRRLVQPVFEDSEFYGFTDFIDEYGIRTYKPLIALESGETNGIVFNRKSYDKYNLGNVLYAYEDFRTGYNFTISADGGSSFNVHAGIFSDGKTNNLNSGGNLVIESATYNGTIASIIGTYTNSLYYQDQILENASDNTSFVLKLDQNADLIDFYTIESQNYLVSNGKYITNSNLSDQSHNSDVQLDDNLKIVHYHFDVKSKKEYLLVRGNGSLIYKGVQVDVLSSSEGLSLIELENNKVNWSKTLGQCNNISSNFSMDIDEDVGICLTFSFEGVFAADGFTLESNDKFDALILKLSSTGRIESYYQSYSEISHHIKQLKIEGKRLTLGGHVDGMSSLIKFGELEFQILDTQTRHGLVSYLNLSSMNDIASQRREDVKLPTAFIELMPNPASESVRLISSNFNLDDKKIKIYNLTGKLVHVQSGKSKEIDISRFQDGVYLVSVRLGDKIVSKKLIIIK